MSLALWLLATAGSALVLTQSTITAPLRVWLAGIASDLSRCEQVLAATEHRPEIRCFRDVNHGGAHRHSLDAHPVRLHARIAAVAVKLVNCPMCSGFWLGMGWGWYLIGRGVLTSFTGAAWAYGFGGSIVSALAVAAWILLQEGHQALALWRYNHPPRKD